MKIIDLLNKIANSEEVPEKIKYDLVEYCLIDYTEDTKLYQSCVEPYSILDIKTDRLNDEVKIIEEDNKIEKLNIYQEKNIKNNWKWQCNGYNISTPQKIIGEKVNELIDEINKIKDQYEK